jgi:large subunit ribosomal protein L15
MITKRKKSSRHRGSFTHSWGHKKKHRGAGSRGGVGKAGTKLHNKFKFWKAGDRLGKIGFKSLAQRNIKPNIVTINIRDINRMEGKEIDLTKMGYDKVLGTGELKRAVTVKANYFSAVAEEKIKKAGGKTIALMAEEAVEESSEIPE